MSTLTLMRIYAKYHNMPRLPIPCIGYAGTLYSSPLIDKQRYCVMDDAGRTTGSPENLGASHVMVKGGAMGSYIFRRFSTSTADIKKAEKERQEKDKFKRQSAETIKIMLVSETGSLLAMNLEEANKLARKKSLNLVHITNPKEKPVSSHKEIYKLVSKLTSLKEDDHGEGEEEEKSVSIKQKEKDLKTVLLKSNTGEHDVNSKISSMKKWITKGHRVRVAITQSGDKGSAETIFKSIEAQMAEVEGQIQQKITKGNELRFYVGPPKKAKADKPTSHPDSGKGKGRDKEDKDEKDDGGGKDPDNNDDDNDKKRKGKKYPQPVYDHGTTSFC